jgi:pyruvate,water dikinase
MSPDSTHALLNPIEALKAGEAQVGGKAWGLARLHEAGSKVPEWLAVPATLCVSGFQAAGLDQVLLEKLNSLQGLDATTSEGRATLDAASKEMRSRVEAIDIEGLLGVDLGATLDSMGEGPWAVRSSMVGEDSEAHSFAGQLDSFLFQADSDVPKAVTQCWGSAFSPHALLYRVNAGLTGLPEVAVVIQRMLSGDASGVAFTAHPVTGRRDHCLVSGAWGQGEGVVSGICDTDEYVWDHAGREDSARIADKDIAVMPDPTGAPGTVETEVPEARRKERCLEPEQLVELGTELVRLQEYFDAPMDIEWTLEKGTLYILQARPITSLPPEPDTSAPVIVFDNSNIQESYCGVTTPLTFSFAQGAYASVYEQTMRVLGLPQETIRAHDDMLQNLLGLVGGRVYYNINNWYRGLLLLPSFGQNKADMERMMGLEEPVDFVTGEQLSFGQKLKRLPRVLGTLIRLLRHFRRLQTEVPAWIDRFERSYSRVDREALREASFSQLMSSLDQIDRDMLHHWHTPIINDFYVMMAVGKLRRALEKAGIEDPDDLVNRLLSGEEDIESTQPVRQLMTIATAIRNDEGARKILAHCDPGHAVEELSGYDSGLAQLFENYIERYGDRCMGELKLETITLREDTTFIGQVLVGYVDRADLVPEKLSEREQAMRAEAEKTLSEAMGWWSLRKAKKALKSARAAVKNRESMRLARTRMFGLYRDVYQSLGAQLKKAGGLNDPRDIFYLSIHEIRDYYEGRAVTSALGPVAEARKQEYQAFEAIEVPHRIVASSPVYQNMPSQEVEVAEADKNARVLHGIGCYPGIVEAEVKVIRSPQDELNLNGRILTAIRTDPGWAPLFPTCSAILIERGSTLSHSAVVARELGIPAVVGVKHLLSIVEDGERVRVDGEQGTATRLDLPEA